MEKIINDKVDGLLVEMEALFKGAVEAHKPLQDELNNEVKKLMDAFDEREETKRYENVKAIADYITLTISMPLGDKLKEEIIGKLVEECEKDGVKH